MEKGQLWKQWPISFSWNREKQQKQQIKTGELKAKSWGCAICQDTKFGIYFVHNGEWLNIWGHYSDLND